MALLGYARVSTTYHDLEIQTAALAAAGCSIIRKEKASGTTRTGRTELEIVLEFLQPGDTLVVTRIDRLARSMKDLRDIVHHLRTRGVALKATEQPIDTAGKAFLDMLGVFAEFETNLRRERQFEGVQVAKAKGVYKSRRPKNPIDADKIARLYTDGMGVSEIARTMGITRMSVYRLLRGLPTPEPVAAATKLAWFNLIEQDEQPPPACT
jgi:DNA invertase Pin-like site-specific DNA recombinase